MFDLWIQVLKFVMSGFVIGLLVGLSMALNINKDNVKKKFKSIEPAILDFLEKVS